MHILHKGLPISTINGTLLQEINYNFENMLISSGHCASCVYYILFMTFWCKLLVLFFKKNSMLDLADVTLAIPIFHSYGHKTSCQVCHVYKS